MFEPKVHIVVLNWNSIEDTFECLDSLCQIQYKNYKIVLVDNASDTSPGEDVEKRYKGQKIHFIENSENLGFPGGNNIGIEYALSDDTDYVLLLNNDTVVDKMFIKELVNVAVIDEMGGIIGPKMYYYDEPNRFWFAGNKKSYVYGKPIQIGHRGYGELDTGQYDSVEEVGFISGCAMFIKRDVFEDIGLLDCDYFFGTEDADFCIKAARAGFKIFYAPKAKIWHKVARALGGLDSPKYVYYQFRNRLIFMNKNFPLWCWLIFAPAFLLIVTRRSIKLLAKGNFKGLTSIMNGIRDFLMNRYGAKQ